MSPRFFTIEPDVLRRTRKALIRRGLEGGREGEGIEGGGEREGGTKGGRERGKEKTEGGITSGMMAKTFAKFLIQLQY